MKYGLPIVLILMLLWNFYGCYRENQINKNWTAILAAENDSVKHFKNAMGQEVAEKKVLQLTLAGLKASHSEEIKGLKKQIGSLSNLVERNKIVTRTGATVYVVLRDTVYLEGSKQVRGKTFSWQDKYLSIQGVIADSMKLSYLYSDTLIRTVFWKRQGNFFQRIFSPKVMVEQITTANPATSVTMLQTYYTKPEPKPWFASKLFQIPAAFAAGWIIAKEH